MRELKFKWYIRGKNGEINIAIRSVENLIFGLQWRPDFTLMDRVQFTGLLDANNVEIYEGDIVCATDGGTGSYDAVVRWDDDGYRFFVDEGCDRLGLDEYTVIKPTVVGNIYENYDEYLPLIAYLNIPCPWQDKE